MLKAYYDGGNKSDSTAYKVLTLAGYAATDSIWIRVERQWTDVLAHHKIGYMHMAEAMSLNGSYSKENGWDEAKVQNLLHDLVGVMESFKRRPVTGVSCTVVLSDYLSARRTFADLPPVENLCMTQCMGVALIWYGTLPRYSTDGYSKLPSECADLYFDRGEPFYGHAVDAWNHKTFRNRDTFKAIRRIEQADMRSVPGLQMADMLAWAHNRQYGSGGHDKLCTRIREAIPEFHRDLKLPELGDIDSEKLNSFKQLRLPRRKPMR